MVKVPIAYGPKEKFITRLEAEPELDKNNGVMITLPRLGFEITGYNFDGAAMSNRNNKV
jgi:GH43 family beta-xylosidase